MSQEPIAADQPPPKPGPVRLAKGQEVSLGCGTLILIAIIVLFCSGWGNRSVESDVRALKSEVQVLRKSLENQTEILQKMQQKLNNIKGGNGEK